MNRFAGLLGSKSKPTTTSAKMRRDEAPHTGFSRNSLARRKTETVERLRAREGARLIAPPDVVKRVDQAIAAGARSKSSTPWARAPCAVAPTAAR